MPFTTWFYYDIASASLSLVSVCYFIRGRTAAWYITLTAACASSLLFWKIKLYGQLFLKVMHVLLAVSGLSHWKHHQDDSNHILVRRHFTMLDGLLAIATIVLGILWYESWLQFSALTIGKVDSFIAFLFLYAQWLASRRYLGVWCLWLLGDLICIPLFFNSGAYCQMLFAILCVPLGINGFFAWRAQYHRQLLRRDG